MGAFAADAERWVAAGAAVIPTGGPEGKRPMVKFRNITPPQPLDQIRAWSNTYGDSNLAVLAIGITCLDIDDPRQAGNVEEIYGPTPMAYSTGGGGGRFHCLYKSSGERNGVKARPGIDIRGLGGYFVVPHSRRPGGGSYEWIRGEPEDIVRLPPIRPGALPQPNIISRGTRNNMLFKLGVLVALNSETQSELLKHLEIMNEARCDPPLPHEEVRVIVASLWRRKREGLLFPPSIGGTLVAHDELDRLLSNPDALALWIIVRKAHAGTGLKNFPLAAKAMANAETLPGWGWKRIRAATDFLVAAGFLRMVRQGTHRGKPSLFAFTASAACPGKGCR